MPRPYLRHPLPLAFAHRGGAKRWPENTLVAFENAIALGYRYIETDVHMTADHRLVCIHDATLDRTTDGRGDVASHTLEQIKQLNAAHRFEVGEGEPDLDRSRCVVPTLEEALALDASVHFNIELKDPRPAAAQRLWELIDHHGVHDRVLVAAADDRTGRRFGQLSGRSVACSPGRVAITQFWLKTKLGLGTRGSSPYDALQVPEYHRGLRVIDRRLVDAAHDRGMQVHAWTIDDPSKMHALLDLGVDGIMTDRPAVLLDVIAERR